MEKTAYVGTAAITFIVVSLLAKKLQGKKSMRPVRPGTFPCGERFSAMFEVGNFPSYGKAPERKCLQYDVF